jgi:sec-independent protein translocase protein TatA
MNVGPTELIVVLVIVLLVFGPKRLPQLGRQLGAGMREFKDSITSRDKDSADDQPSLTDAVEARNDAAAVGSAKPTAADAESVAAEPGERS